MPFAAWVPGRARLLPRSLPGLAARWRRLGRLLPRDVRERAYEPALADLLHQWLTRPDAAHRLPFGLYAVATALGCLPIAIPRLFVRRGTLTRLSRVLLGGLAALLVAVWLLQSYTRTLPGY